MQDHWHSPMTGGPGTAFHGLEPVSMIIGEVRAGYGLLMREVTEIKGQLAEGRDVHHDHDKRISALETKTHQSPPALEVWIKYAASLAIPLATLWLTGSFEAAKQVLELLAKASAGH